MYVLDRANGQGIMTYGCYVDELSDAGDRAFALSPSLLWDEGAVPSTATTAPETTTTSAGASASASTGVSAVIVCKELCALWLQPYAAYRPVWTQGGGACMCGHNVSGLQQLGAGGQVCNYTTLTEFTVYASAPNLATMGLQLQPANATTPTGVFSGGSGGTGGSDACCGL